MNGTVNINIDDYNKMLIENSRLKAAVQIKKDWSDAIVVEFYIPAFAPAIVEKFNQSAYADSHKLNNLSDLYNPSITIANKLEVPADEDEPTV